MKGISDLDFEKNRLDCMYCKMVAILSKNYKTYVCDDCYAKVLGGDKKKDERSDGTI